jgi:hypothetical protein
MPGEPPPPGIRNTIWTSIRQHKQCPSSQQCPDVPEGKEHCSNCPVVEVERALAEEHGDILARVHLIDMATENKLTVTMSEVTVEELVVLNLLRSERHKYQIEKAEEDSRRQR